MTEFNAFGSLKQKTSPSSTFSKGHETPGQLRDAFINEFGATSLTNIAHHERRHSWIEIDLLALMHNVRTIKAMLSPQVRFMAVVKADAYGHGAAQIARAALFAGASDLGVATVDEGISLRMAEIAAPILLLSQPPVEAIPLLLAYNIVPAIYTIEFAMEYAEFADKYHMEAPYHLAINTGMNRIGVHHDEVIEFVSMLDFHRALERVGTFTHYATADMPDTLDFDVQYNRFVTVIEAMREAGFDPGIVHACASAAALRYPKSHFDMVRIGIAMYGFSPCDEVRGKLDLRPVMSVHARITAVYTPNVGEGVSYGYNYRSPGGVYVCTVPLGYADGLSRSLSGNIHIIYNGHIYRQVGNICMDQCMFEIDMRSYDLPAAPRIGDEVIIVGEQGSAFSGIERMCDILHTIPYEVVCGFALRMPRVYVQ
ncbi:MAG: alanine racemase [Eggerthellaceae bacterium]|nr:alanine racemase [Eggerthellaceae bacterium]